MVASIPTSAERVNPIGMTISPNWLLAALGGDVASCTAYESMPRAGAHNMSAPPILTCLWIAIRSAPVANRTSLAALTVYRGARGISPGARCGLVAALSPKMKLSWGGWAARSVTHTTFHVSVTCWSVSPEGVLIM